MSLITHKQREDLNLRGLGVLELIAADPPSARRQYGRIRVALPAVPGQASLADERRLDRQLKASGSGPAVGTMLLTTVAYVGYLALSQTQLSGSWRQFAVGAAMVLAGAALGKVLGLFYWNLLLRRTASRLRSMVAARPKNPTRTHSLQKEFPPHASANPGKIH